MARAKSGHSDAVPYKGRDAVLKPGGCTEPGLLPNSTKRAECAESERGMTQQVEERKSQTRTLKTEGCGTQTQESQHSESAPPARRYGEGPTEDTLAVIYVTGKRLPRP
jgi:hypothetical protein